MKPRNFKIAPMPFGIDGFKVDFPEGKRSLTRVEALAVAKALSSCSEPSATKDGSRAKVETEIGIEWAKENPFMASAALNSFFASHLGWETSVDFSRPGYVVLTALAPEESA